MRVVGVGTNLLVRDAGVSGRPSFDRGGVLQSNGRGKKREGRRWSESLFTDQRASLAGLAGFETLVGITATVGGTLRFNAGDRSGEIADSLVSRRGHRFERKVVVREAGRHPLRRKRERSRRSRRAERRVRAARRPGCDREADAASVDQSQGRSAFESPGGSSSVQESTGTNGGALTGSQAWCGLAWALTG